MSSHPIHLEGDNQAGDLSPKVARFGLGLAVVGLGIGAVLGFMSNDHDAYSHFWFAYLVAFCFVLTIALGATFFNIIQHLVNAHWSVSVRRLSELTMASIPLLAIFALPLLVPLFSDDVEVWKWASMVRGMALQLVTKLPTPSLVAPMVSVLLLKLVLFRIWLPS